MKPDRPRQIGGKAVKYESPRGQPNQIYIPPGVDDLLTDPSRGLLLTEGEKKSACATQHGFPCIGLVGVHGWKEKNRESLLPALERIAWKNRTVYLVFDSDVAEKEEVQDAESRLAAHLTNRGAKVSVCRIPSGPAGEDGKPTKQGIDDYAVAADDPIRAIRTLLDAAEEPIPPSAIEMKMPARLIDSGPEANRFLESTLADGMPRLRFWRGSWMYWSRTAYAEIPPSEARAELVKHLDKRFSNLTGTATSNVVDCLKAKAILPGRTEPPAWIGDKPGPWPADQVLATKSKLIHLPSLVTNTADCAISATPRVLHHGRARLQLRGRRARRPRG